MAKTSRLSYETRRYVIEEAYRRVLAEVDHQIKTCTSPEHYPFRKVMEDIGRNVAKQLARHIKQMNEEESQVEPVDFSELLRDC